MSPINELLLRTLAILAHAAANFLLVTYLFNYDITAKWVRFIGFIALTLVLLFLFIKHLLNYIYFIKTKTR